MHHKQERDWDELKKLGYEPEVVQLKGVAISMIVFLGFVAFALVAAGGAFVLVNPVAFAKPEPDKMYSKKIPEAPNPLLQTNITTKTDIMQMRQTERKGLESYGPVDAKHVHVPIDRAIDLAIEKGLIASKEDPNMVMTGKNEQTLRRVDADCVPCERCLGSGHPQFHASACPAA